MKSNLMLIIRREYLERVKRKSFILSTILMPLLMIVLMVAPTAIMILTGPQDTNIAVIDHTGAIAPMLQSDDNVRFHPSTQVPLDSLKNNEYFNNILIIEADVVDNPSHVTFYSHGAASIQTESYVSSQLENAIEDIRLKRYDIPDLDKILNDIDVDVTMKTMRLDADQETSTSSMVSYMIGLIMTLMLYMFIMIYGNMVMSSIIEEKNNRVLEIVVSSVRPDSILAGKIIGIGLVALTQVLIWAVLIMAFSSWAMPMISSSLGPDADVELLGAMEQIGNTGYIFTIIISMVFLLIGGYLFYSTIYAAIGSAVDNIQDASQLTSLAVVPIILGLVFAMSAVADPNSAFAFWLSIIPFTSPMVMIARVPFGIPAWQIVLSVVVLYASFAAMIWICAKIYRIGIFMYGKKPTIKELIRWARYK